MKIKYSNLFWVSSYLFFITLLLLTPTKTYSISESIVISEVQIAGDSASDDFVELYNLTDSDINLGDYRLVKRTATGTTDSSLKAFENDDVIPADGYFLWSNSNWDPGVVADASTSATIAANNGIALRLGDEDTGQIIDSVAWGNATNAFVEGSAYPDNPESGTSIQRVGDDTDTDDNSVDFILNESPDPQNSAAGPAPSASPSASPTSTPTPSPSATPSATPSPTPEPSLSPSPSSSPSPEPSEEPTPSPSPTPEPSLSPSPTPEPTSRSRVLAIFKNRICRLEYRQLRIGFLRVSFPRIVCERI